MSHSEKNEPPLPIRSPELKSEIAANTGLNCQQSRAENIRLQPSWRSERDSDSRYGPTTNCFTNRVAEHFGSWRPVAILEKQKAALADGLLVLGRKFSYLFGCGEPQPPIPACTHGRHLSAQKRTLPRCLARRIISRPLRCRERRIGRHDLVAPSMHFRRIPIASDPIMGISVAGGRSSTHIACSVSHEMGRTNSQPKIGLMFCMIQTDVT
jgi:hypothetical protein